MCFEEACRGVDCAVGIAAVRANMFSVHLKQAFTGIALWCPHSTELSRQVKECARSISEENSFYTAKSLSCEVIGADKLCQLLGGSRVHPVLDIWDAGGNHEPPGQSGYMSK